MYQQLENLIQQCNKDCLNECRGKCAQDTLKKISTKKKIKSDRKASTSENSYGTCGLCPMNTCEKAKLTKNVNIRKPCLVRNGLANSNRAIGKLACPQLEIKGNAILKQGKERRTSLKKEATPLTSQISNYQLDEAYKVPYNSEEENSLSENIVVSEKLVENVTVVPTKSKDNCCGRTLCERNLAKTKQEPYKPTKSETNAEKDILLDTAIQNKKNNSQKEIFADISNCCEKKLCPRSKPNTNQEQIKFLNTSNQNTYDDITVTASDREQSIDEYINTISDSVIVIENRIAANTNTYCCERQLCPRSKIINNNKIKTLGKENEIVVHDNENNDICCDSTTRKENAFSINDNKIKENSCGRILCSRNETKSKAESLTLLKNSSENCKTNTESYNEKENKVTKSYDRITVIEKESNISANFRRSKDKCRDDCYENTLVKQNKAKESTNPIRSYSDVIKNVNEKASIEYSNTKPSDETYKIPNNIKEFTKISANTKLSKDNFQGTCCNIQNKTKSNEKHTKSDISSIDNAKHTIDNCCNNNNLFPSNKTIIHEEAYKESNKNEENLISNKISIADTTIEVLVVNTNCTKICCNKSEKSIIAAENKQSKDEYRDSCCGMQNKTKSNEKPMKLINISNEKVSKISTIMYNTQETTDNCCKNNVYPSNKITIHEEAYKKSNQDEENLTSGIDSKEDTTILAENKNSKNNCCKKLEGIKSENNIIATQEQELINNEKESNNQNNCCESTLIIQSKTRSNEAINISEEHTDRSSDINFKKESNFSGNIDQIIDDCCNSNKIISDQEPHRKTSKVDETLINAVSKVNTTYEKDVGIADENKNLEAIKNKTVVLDMPEKLRNNNEIDDNITDNKNKIDDNLEFVSVHSDKSLKSNTKTSKLDTHVKHKTSKTRNEYIENNNNKIQSKCEENKCVVSDMNSRLIKKNTPPNHSFNQKSNFIKTKSADKKIDKKVIHVQPDNINKNIIPSNVCEINKCPILDVKSKTNKEILAINIKINKTTSDRLDKIRNSDRDISKNLCKEKSQKYKCSKLNQNESEFTTKTQENDEDYPVQDTTLQLVDLKKSNKKDIHIGNAINKNETIVDKEIHKNIPLKNCDINNCSAFNIKHKSKQETISVRESFDHHDSNTNKTAVETSRIKKPDKNPYEICVSKSEANKCVLKCSKLTQKELKEKNQEDGKNINETAADAYGEILQPNKDPSYKICEDKPKASKCIAKCIELDQNQNKFIEKTQKEDENIKETEVYHYSKIDLNKSKENICIPTCIKFSQKESEFTKITQENDESYCVKGTTLKFVDNNKSKEKVYMRLEKFSDNINETAAAPLSELNKSDLNEQTLSECEYICDLDVPKEEHLDKCNNKDIPSNVKITVNDVEENDQCKPCVDHDFVFKNITKLSLFEQTKETLQLVENLEKTIDEITQKTNSLLEKSGADYKLSKIRAQHISVKKTFQKTSGDFSQNSCSDKRILNSKPNKYSSECKQDEINQENLADILPSIDRIQSKCNSEEINDDTLRKNETLENDQTQTTNKNSELDLTCETELFSDLSDYCTTLEKYEESIENFLVEKVNKNKTENTKSGKMTSRKPISRFEQRTTKTSLKLNVGNRIVNREANSCNEKSNFLKTEITNRPINMQEKNIMHAKNIKGSTQDEIKGKQGKTNTCNEDVSVKCRRRVSNLNSNPREVFEVFEKIQDKDKPGIKSNKCSNKGCHGPKFGDRGSGFKTKGDPQDFYSLRDQCLQEGTLFEDPEFLPIDSSLFFSRRADRHYEWRRPSEISDNPQLFVEGYSRFDVQQGELGDCWLLAAVANLTLYKRLFFQVVPDDQGFDENYAGIFHFRFWQYGKWIDVVIDDRLPTYRGELIFLHSTEPNEFWSALLEKAYAKLHGSYEALKGGSTCEAMEDFTGGVTEMYEMDASPPNLFKIILKAHERSSLMGCSIEPDPNVLEAETPEGLIRGHAYSITQVKYVDISTPNVTGKIPLLRLRNPWGNEAEWNGAWSDESPEWRYISESEKEEVGLNFDNDGEFWISFKDFQQHFSRLEICNLNPDSLTEEEIREGNKKKWEASVYEGEWVRGVSAGGCRNFIDTFWQNPQYRITISEQDEGDEEGNCTLIVALMQKHRRTMRNTGVEELTIGFAIYHLRDPDRVPKPLDINFFKYNASVARSPSFINLREVSCRFKLPPGTYCIVPSTFDPNEEGEFLLRVFSENCNSMEEHDEELGYNDEAKKIPTESPTEHQESEELYQEFLKLAGTDQEIDWFELKKLLDLALKRELDRPIISSEPTKTNIPGLNATPIDSGTQNNDTQNLITTILGLLCGALCKGTAFADIIPTPDKCHPLGSIFTELKQKGFSKDICRSMVSMLDFDRSGKLGYEEFKNLWLLLKKWKGIWYQHDKDRSGSFSGFELRDALNGAGYNVNTKVLNSLMHRYGNKEGQIEFDDFIMCAIKLKTMFDIFKEKDNDNTNQASFTLEEWLDKTIH